jgi:hypothetical protein
MTTLLVSQPSSSPPITCDKPSRSIASIESTNDAVEVRVEDIR